MNSDAISQLENLCQGPIPSACRAVLTDYPEVLRGVPRADDGSDSEGFVSDAELLADAAAVLRMNEEVRKESILDPDGHEFCWPMTFLVIGETGDGDYYCVDTAGEHNGVMQFRHHTVEFEMVAESISDFVELLVECFVEDGADSDDGDELDEFEELPLVE
jgi:hypothetical protein